MIDRFAAIGEQEVAEQPWPRHVEPDEKKESARLQASLSLSHDSLYRPAAGSQ